MPTRLILIAAIATSAGAANAQRSLINPDMSTDPFARDTRAQASPQPEEPGEQATPGRDAKPEPEGLTSPRDYGFFSGRYIQATRPEWPVEVETNIWFVSPGGEFSLGGSPLVSTADVNIDSPHVGPMLDVRLTHGKWDTTFTGSIIRAEGFAQLPEDAMFGGTTVAAGTIMRSRYRLDSAELRVGYRFFEFDADPNVYGRPMFGVGVRAIGGLRLYDAAFDVLTVSGPAFSQRGSITHIEPLVGFGAEISFADRYEIEILNSYGGTPEIDDQQSVSIDIQTAFKWHPLENLAIQVGYRLRRNILEGSDIELDGAAAGLFGGVSMRF